MSRRLSLTLKIMIVTAILLVWGGIAFAQTSVIGIIFQPNQDFRPATYKYFVAGKDGMATGVCQYLGAGPQYTCTDPSVPDFVLENFIPTLALNDQCVFIFEKEDNAGTATHKGYYAVTHQVINPLNTHYDVLWSDSHAVPQPISTAGIGQFVINWSAAVDDGSGNIKGYNLYRSTDPTFSSPGLPLNGGTPIPFGTTNFTDSTASPTTRYYYAIRIVFRGADPLGSNPTIESYLSENSNPSWIPPDATAPVIVPANPVTDGPTPGIDIDMQGSTTPLSANWVGTFSDPESGIWYYEYAIGTITPGATNIVGWTNVGTSTGMTNSVSISVGQTYYVTVRATNGAGLTSSPANSDGVTIVTDTTPPVTTSAYVNDGTGADIDFQNSRDTLSANWGGFSDPQSGISGYTYAIGTTLGGTDVIGWTAAGGTSVTVGSLTLDLNKIYYVSVRAYNGVGLYSELSSDGITVVNIGERIPNYPNPFNPPTESTRIVIDVPGPMDLGVYIYDITARLVFKQVILGANGLTEVIWNGVTYYGQVADNGVYLLRVIDEDSKEMIGKGKILVIKR